MIAAPPESAWYVYGVVEAGDGAARAAAACGVELVDAGGLAGIVSRVPADEFSEERLPAMLNDRVWLEAKARAHEEVLQRMSDERAVVPLRFGTIFHDSADVARLLERHRTELDATLERVRGCVELGVKAWAAPAPPEPAAAAPASGRDYLERRRAESRRATEQSARAAELVGAVHERLAALAVDAVVNRPQSRELSGRSEEMLLNAAYLVRRGDDRLPADVERLNEELRDGGVLLELTGPWPPHNFVDVEGVR